MTISCSALYTYLKPAWGKILVVTDFGLKVWVLRYSYIYIYVYNCKYVYRHMERYILRLPETYNLKTFSRTRNSSPTQTLKP